MQPLNEIPFDISVHAGYSAIRNTITSGQLLSQPTKGDFVTLVSHL